MFAHQRFDFIGKRTQETHRFRWAALSQSQAGLN
jgi:hypothetical protein